MAYFLFALLLFSASVTVHIFFCRKAAGPGLQASAFIFISILFLGIYISVVWAIHQAGILPAQSVWGLPFGISSGIVFVLLVPLYLCFYVLTQLVSPSKKILQSLSVKGSLSYADIVLCIKEEDFINKRLSDLETSGCIKQVEGRYRLSLAGQKIADVLDMMQCILGRDMGG